MNKNKLTYENSGVNIKAADKFVKFISLISKKTKQNSSFNNIGSFGSVNKITKKLKNPYIVNCLFHLMKKIKFPYNIYLLLVVSSSQL